MKDNIYEIYATMLSQAIITAIIAFRTIFEEKWGNNTIYMLPSVTTSMLLCE